MANKKKSKKWLWITLVILGLLATTAALSLWPRNKIPTVSRGTLERFPQF